MHPRRVRQSILQEILSQKVPPSRPNDVGVAVLNTRESLEDAEGGFRKARSEPWSSAGFLIDARVDVAEEAGELLFLAGFGFEVDEEGFAAFAAVDAVDVEDWVLRVAFGPRRLVVGEFGFPGGGA